MVLRFFTARQIGWPLKSQIMNLLVDSVPFESVGWNARRLLESAPQSQGHLSNVLSPLLHEHNNMLGRYSFSMPDAVAKGELRPLRNPEDSDS
jgi:hypothetical protein